MRDGRDQFDGFADQGRGIPEDPLTTHPSHDAGAAHIPGHLVDRFFDRELTRGESAGLFESFNADSASAKRFVQTQRMIDALREPVRAPDLTRSILSRMNEQSPDTPLLSRRGVRQVRVGRFVAAAALVAIIAGAFVMQRVKPNVVDFGVEPKSPLISLRNTVAGDASDAMNTIVQTARAIEVTAASSVRANSPRDTRESMVLQPVSMMRARFVPENAFPWRHQSAAPEQGRSTKTRVPWVVPCGSAPCDAGTGRSGQRAGMFLIDVTGTETPGSGAGRNPGSPLEK